VEESCGGDGEEFGVGAWWWLASVNLDWVGGRQTAIREPKYLIAGLELPLLSFGTELLYDTTELNAEDQADVGGKRVFALPLEEVHAVQAKGLNAHESFGGLGRRFWDRGVQEEGGGGACAVLDIW
jgi:hypothetical protein